MAINKDRIEKEIEEVLKANLGLKDEEIEISSLLVEDLGMESLTWLTVFNDLEGRFKIHFEIDDMILPSTVEDLVGLTYQLANE